MLHERCGIIGGNVLCRRWLQFQLYSHLLGCPDMQIPAIPQGLVPVENHKFDVLYSKVVCIVWLW